MHLLDGIFQALVRLCVEMEKKETLPHADVIAESNWALGDCYESK